MPLLTDVLQRVRPVRRRLFACVLAGLAAASLLCLPAFAQNPTAISQGFQGSGNIVPGAIVSLKSGSTNQVENASAATATSLIGVVGKSTLVALSQANDQVQIIVTGSAFTFVSDINGAIHAGDKITASPIAGVGMKATTDTQIIGTAQEPFQANQAASQTITDASGTKHTVHVGQIRVGVNVSFYAAPTSKFLPPFVQNLANSVAGKQVSLVRVGIACALLLLALISMVVLLYTSIRAGILSIGRNPLAASAIRKGLVEVGISTLLILAFTLVSTYFILTI